MKFVYETFDLNGKKIRVGTIDVEETDERKAFTAALIKLSQEVGSLGRTPLRVSLSIALPKTLS